MRSGPASAWRLPLILAFALLLWGAAPRPAGAGTTAASTQATAPGANSTSTTLSTSASASATSFTALTTASNSTSASAHATDLAILYYSIPELVVLVFFAVGIYLILVRDVSPRHRRR